jgi:hypothetical protein
VDASGRLFISDLNSSTITEVTGRWFGNKLKKLVRKDLSDHSIYLKRGAVIDIAVSQFGGFIFASHFQTGLISLIDAETAEVIDEIGTGGIVQLAMLVNTYFDRSRTKTKPRTSILIGDFESDILAISDLDTNFRSFSEVVYAQLGMHALRKTAWANQEVRSPLMLSSDINQRTIIVGHHSSDRALAFSRIGNSLERRNIIFLENTPIDIDMSPNGNILVILNSGRNSLKIIPNPTEFTTETTAGVGSKQIREVQRALSRLGYPVGVVDGFEGPDTRRALMIFQKDKGLKPTGKIDEKTYDALFKVVTTPVYIEAGTSESLNAIREKMAQLATVHLIENNADAHFVIQQQDGDIAIKSPVFEVILPPVSTSDPNLVQRVIDQVEDLAHWKTVMDLENPNATIKLKLEIRDKSDEPSLPERQQVTPGSKLTYRIENLDSRPLYVNLLVVSSDGQIAQIYPSLSRDYNRPLLPKQTISRDVITYLPEGLDSAIDVYKVIATTQYIDPSIFINPRLRVAQRSRVIQSDLSLLLSDSIRGQKITATPDLDKEWVTTQKTLIVKRPSAKLSGYVIHIDKARKLPDMRKALERTIKLCTGRDDAKDCNELTDLLGEGTEFELRNMSIARQPETATLRSVGQAFEEAYEIQDRTGASRVEPQLEVQVPWIDKDHGIDRRAIGSDNNHDEAAKKNDDWHLRQIRAFYAWEKIRNAQGFTEGREAEGILVAHIDTGYQKHPETWEKVNGIRPIDPGKGYDYYDNDNDPTDPLLDSLPLDFPGHGTASGSVIISPSGCQLEGADACVNGVARGAQLVPLRVHRTVSQLNTANLTRAIRDAAKGKVSGAPKLVSIAMGGPPTLAMWKAVRAAEDKGVLVIAAAGNYVGTVVWPARFRSTIAVAASNVRCRPWAHSSSGSKIDISAPGESVWRALINKDHRYMNGMGKGTTFATGNTTGAAALWLSWHRDNPKLAQLRQKGMVTQAFREALKASAWQPSANPSENPEGTLCYEHLWDTDKFGPGILDIAGLLDVPLDPDIFREKAVEEMTDLPLFSSLYIEGTRSDRIRSDYYAIFGTKYATRPEYENTFETEIMYHYTMNKEVQLAIDGVLQGQRGVDPIQRVRDALLKQDLSVRLRDVLETAT